MFPIFFAFHVLPHVVFGHEVRSSSPDVGSTRLCSSLGSSFAEVSFVPVRSEANFATSFSLLAPQVRLLQTTENFGELWIASFDVMVELDA